MLKKTGFSNHSFKITKSARFKLKFLNLKLSKTVLKIVLAITIEITLSSRLITV